jgi:hypothetical protein
VKPYGWAIALLWGLPALVVGIGHVVLPDHNSSGQCEGIGFGCTMTPADTILLLGMLAAPVLLIAGLAAIVGIAVWQSLARRGERADQPGPHG